MASKRQKPTYPFRRAATNPHVFLEIGVTGVGTTARGDSLDPCGLRMLGRVEIELFVHEYPAAADNFRALCTGEYGIGVYGKPLHYKGSRLHKIVPGCVVGGDILTGTGASGESIYGPEFTTAGVDMEKTPRTRPQPGRDVRHSTDVGPGAVTAVPVGSAHKYSSQFKIWTTAHREAKNVVFGRVSKGFPVVKEIERLGMIRSGCVMEFVVANCGMAASIYSPLPVPPSLVIPRIYPSDAVLPPQTIVPAPMLPSLVAPPVMIPPPQPPVLPPLVEYTYTSAAPTILPPEQPQPLMLTYYHQDPVDTSAAMYMPTPQAVTATSQHYTPEQLQVLQKLQRS